MSVSKKRSLVTKGYWTEYIELQYLYIIKNTFHSFCLQDVAFFFSLCMEMESYGEVFVLSRFSQRRLTTLSKDSETFSFDVKGQSNSAVRAAEIPTY